MLQCRTARMRFTQTSSSPWWGHTGTVTVGLLVEARVTNISVTRYIQLVELLELRNRKFETPAVFFKAVVGQIEDFCRWTSGSGQLNCLTLGENVDFFKGMSSKINNHSPYLSDEDSIKKYRSLEDRKNDFSNEQYKGRTWLFIYL